MSGPTGQVVSARVKGGGVDLYAAGVSTLCVVHCLALPLLSSLLPLAGQLAENAFAHRALVLLAAPATLWAGWQSLSSGHWSFLLIALCGLGLLLISAFATAVSAYEQPLTVVGALLLAAAHLSRWARHRRGKVLPGKWAGPHG